MGKYEGYNHTSGKNATMKYIKEKTKQVVIRWKKEDYDNRIRPGIERSGLPMATFIKQAVEEKLVRDGFIPS